MMAVTISGLVDQYISSARNIIDPEGDTFESQKALAIEVALNIRGYASEGALPSSNVSVNVLWKEYIAILACLRLLTSIEFASIQSVEEREFDMNTKVRYAERKSKIEGLTARLTAAVTKHEKSLGLTGQSSLPYMTKMARVDLTKSYDKEGYEI